MAKIKLTAQETVFVWNILNEKYELRKDDPVFKVWFQRLTSYMKPEIEIWNGLNEKERLANGAIELSFPVDKIEAEHMPELITKNEADILKKVVEGDIKVYESQLQKQLKKADKKK